MRKREREREYSKCFVLMHMYLGNVQTLHRRPEHIKISHFEITRDIFSQCDLLLRFLQLTACNHVLQQVQLSSNNYSTATTTTTKATIKCCCHLQNATRQTPSQKLVEEIIILSTVVVVVAKPCSVLFLYPVPMGYKSIIAL